jgi:hypothetical protein
MKYTLIKGTFHVVGSLMFKARNQARWDKIVTDQSCF